jgi:prepilin-type N-terminal cleavage/methylation domain-containing protein
VTPTGYRRRGWSLIELLAVLAVATALLTIAAGLVFQMLKVGGAERSRVVATANMERLGHDLRADAHSATKLDDLGAWRLLLSLPGGRSIEYTVRNREILRTVRRGEKVDHREEYGLPSATRVRFESMRDETRSLVAAVLSFDAAARPDRAADPGYRDYRIEAVLGRDAQLASGGSR